MGVYTKKICFDEELKLEAYQFTGVSQKMYTHFHDYYVVGLIEVGERRLEHNHRELKIGAGDLLTFNPMDKQACEQTDGGSWSYRCLNITQDIMADVAREVINSESPPIFCAPVQYRTDLASIFLELHESIMNGEAGLKKVELFLLFMQEALTAYTRLKINEKLPESRKKLKMSAPIWKKITRKASHWIC